jgi:hypothetical protein
MGYFDDPEPCPHVKPPDCCSVGLKLRDAPARLEKVANTIRIIAPHDPDTRLQLPRKAYSLVGGVREAECPNTAATAC